MAIMKTLEFEEEKDGKIVSIRISGTLTREDYQAFLPELDRLMTRHGKIRMIVKLVDFHGWTAAAMWQDARFDINHFDHIERLAFIGDAKWEKRLAAFSSALPDAPIRYFDVTQEREARRWIEED